MKTGPIAMPLLAGIPLSICMFIYPESVLDIHRCLGGLYSLELTQLAAKNLPGSWI
jgi:hypothetical protein